METSLSKSYRSQLEYTPEYWILSAEKDFKSANIKLTNPRYIDDEIANEKNILSKLKFLYLEQETRYEFLKHICENNQDITDLQVEEIRESTQESKLRLKHLKQQLNQQIGHLETITKEVSDLYEKYLELTTTTLFDEAEELEEEIAKLKESEDNWETLDFMLQGSNNTKALEEQQKKLQQLEDQIEVVKRKYTTSTNNVNELSSELAELNQTIQTSQDQHQVVNQELQQFGQWNIAMNKLLQNLTKEKITTKIICATKGNYKLMINENEYVVFTTNYKVLEVVGIGQGEVFLRNINSKNLDSDSFMSELAKFISK